MLTSCVSIVCCTNRSYSPDKSINPYQDGAVYYLLKKASNPTTLSGLDVDSAIVGQASATSMSNSKKASLLDVFADKCDRSDEVSYLKNKAAYFIKDRTTSLLSRAFAQRYLDPQRQQGDYEDGIVRDGTPEGVSVSRSNDFLLSFKSGFHLVGLKGYGQMPFEISGRVRTLFQSLGHSDGGPSSSAFFSLASLGSKAVDFLSGATPVQDIFEKSDEVATTVSESVSDEFATQTEDYIIRFVGNMDAICTCLTDMQLPVLPWLLVLLVILPYFGSLNPSSSLKTNQRGKYGKMKRYGRGSYSKILASLFFLGCIVTAFDTDDGSEVGMQVCLYSLCT